MDSSHSIAELETSWPPRRGWGDASSGGTTYDHGGLRTAIPKHIYVLRLAFSEFRGHNCITGIREALEVGDPRGFCIRALYIPERRSLLDTPGRREHAELQD